MSTQLDPLVQRILDAFNSRSPDQLDALLTDDVVLLRAGEKAHGRDEFKAVLARVLRAFPDMQYRIEDALVAGDKIIMRWQARGTHRGEYLGVPATGRTIEYNGITIYEMRDGKIARAYVAADLLSLLRMMHEARAGISPEARV
jgi:steroid delta-isomerase-like uncharacterized protein